LAFYRDALGMRVAGESENFGIEHEHLNNVFGARLRITALRAQFISSGVVSISTAEQSTAKLFVVRHPDGHAMQLNER
jgi:catechol 2,3-dioxygenase-like lactoylglutathione lyase family enzyme